MARVADLTAATTPLAGAELVYLVQNGHDRKVPVSNLIDGITKSAVLAALGLSDIIVTDTQITIRKTGADLVLRQTIIQLEVP